MFLWAYRKETLTLLFISSLERFYFLIFKHTYDKLLNLETAFIRFIHAYFFTFDWFSRAIYPYSILVLYSLTQQQQYVSIHSIISKRLNIFQLSSSTELLKAYRKIFHGEYTLTVYQQNDILNCNTLIHWHFNSFYLFSRLLRT